MSRLVGTYHALGNSRSAGQFGLRKVGTETSITQHNCRDCLHRPHGIIL